MALSSEKEVEDSECGGKKDPGLERRQRDNRRKLQQEASRG